MLWKNLVFWVVCVCVCVFNIFFWDHSYAVSGTNTESSSVPFTQILPMNTFWKTRVQYHNQDIDIDTENFPHHRDRSFCFLVTTHNSVLATTYLFSISITWSAFRGWCFSGIIRYVTFWDWLFLLSMIHNVV